MDQELEELKPVLFKKGLYKIFEIYVYQKVENRIQFIVDINLTKWNQIFFYYL